MPVVDKIRIIVVEQSAGELIRRVAVHVLDVLSKNRSLFEIFIVPLLVFLFGIFMFINYTP